MDRSREDDNVLDDYDNSGNDGDEEEEEEEHDADATEQNEGQVGRLAITLAEIQQFLDFISKPSNQAIVCLIYFN
jgi:hypothetical protein